MQFEHGPAAWDMDQLMVAILKEIRILEASSHSRTSSVCTPPKGKLLNFEFEIDFISNQCKMIQYKTNTIKQIETIFNEYHGEMNAPTI